MKPTDIIKKYLPQQNTFNFKVGDTVDVHYRVTEGSRERVHIFEGTIIAIRGEGNSKTFTVRRVVQGVGVEMIFPVNSPNLVKVESKKYSRVRRAKLFYLRKKIGREAKLTQVFVKADDSKESQESNQQQK